MNYWAKKFVDNFNDAAKKSSRTLLFDNFLKISAAVLQRDEKTFAAIDNKELHCKLFSLFANALEFDIRQKVLRDKHIGLDLRIPMDSSHKPCYRDELGEIFHALELFDQGCGQVFTPQHVANIMGETNLTPELVQRELTQKGFVTILENCCGSGALIFGGLNALLKHNVNPNHFAFVKAGDTDMRCVLMTFIQLSLYMIPAVVFCRDALSNDFQGECFLTPILQRKMITRRQ